MNWFLAGTVCAMALGLSIEATEKSPKNSTPPNPPPPFDADLFRKDEQVISGHAEFLYWTLEEGGLDYALKMTEPAWGPSDSYAQGDFQTGGYGFNPGFRVALSFFRAPRYWEVLWDYTRIVITGRDQAEAPTDPSLFLTGTWPQITPNPLVSADSHLKFFYNTANMTVARVFFPNPHLRMRFTGGPTAAWMNQDWVVQYFDTAGNITRMHNHWSFGGAGLSIGSTVDWYWFGQGYLTASSTLGVLVGTYHNLSKQTTTAQLTAGDNTAIPVRNARLSDIRSAFSIQGSLGPSWQKNFKQARVEVFAGYEATVWINLQEMYHSTAASAFLAKETWVNTSMLVLQGITVRLTGDF